MQSEEQRLRALEVANLKRTAGKEWKAELRGLSRNAGLRVVADVVRAQGGDELGHLTLRAALIAPVFTGPAFARKVCRAAGLQGGESLIRLRDLGARRAGRVADAVLWFAERHEERVGVLAESDPDRLFTVPEVAAFTGVSEQSIRQAIADGKLAAVRPLGPRSHFRIRRAAYLEWLGG